MAKPITRDYTHYWVFADLEPFAWPNENATWLPLPKSDVSYCVIDSFEPIERDKFDDNGVTLIKTPCGSSVPVYPALDKSGKLWAVPVIVNEHGPCLSLSWRMDENGVITRTPSEEQQRIIETCSNIREAIFSDEGLGGMPMDMAAAAVALIMSYSYHVHPSEFLLHGLVDDHLAQRVLMAAAGCGNAEYPLDA